MAATGTPTPNIGLRIPQGTDPASVDDINYNSTLLDTKLGAVGNESVQDQIDALNSKIQTIGSINTGTNTASSVSCASGAVTEISEIALAIGTWIIVANATWGANADGYRQIAFDDSSANPNRAKSTITGAFASKEINQQIVRIEKCAALTTKKIYALQNSGSALNCYPYVYAIRISYDWE